MKVVRMTKPKSIFFTFPYYDYLATSLKISSNEGQFSLERFTNQELHLTLKTSVTSASCIVLGSLSPPEINLISFLILCHTLKKEKAKKITALIPYLAYTRHDKEETHKSHITPLVGQLLKTSGIDRVITCDVHSSMVENLFPIPIISLSPAKIFASELKKISFLDATIVSPDKGAINRCEDVVRELKMNSPVTYISKKRTDVITHFELHGNVKERVVIIDDILDTGKTLISCCEKLLEKGVKEIIIFITHGLFTGDEWKRLWDLKVKKIYCTNSLPLPKHLLSEKRISVLSIIPLINETLE